MRFALCLVLAVLTVGGCEKNLERRRGDCTVDAVNLLRNPTVPSEYHDALVAIWRHCVEPVDK